MTSGPLAARWFRVIATFEAISWTALLIAMFLKWVVHAPHEGGVPVVGMVHGVGFVVYLVSTAWAGTVLRWGPRTTVLGWAAGIPPFGTVVFERRMARQGRLSARSARGRTAAASQG
jgi:integral membrane protein